MTGRHAITAAEYDQIVAALRVRPEAIDDIALAFNRSSNTIEKMRGKAGLGRLGSAAS